MDEQINVIHTRKLHHMKKQEQITPKYKLIRYISTQTWLGKGNANPQNGLKPKQESQLETFNHTYIIKTLKIAMNTTSVHKEDSHNLETENE